MLTQGSIIRANIFDPQGRNQKTRPLVVITPSQEILGDLALVAVAVTGKFSQPLDVDEVMLPYHPAGLAASGLRKPCVAKCSWLVALQLADVLEVKGNLPAERTREILAKVAALGTSP